MTDTRNSDSEVIRAEEVFVADAQLLLHEIMIAKGITRAQLAERLGISRARISQLFSSECTNFTVRMLARTMHALEEVPAVSCGWTERRDRASRSQKLTDLIAVSANNVVSIWAPDGVIVPPDDHSGECKSDARLRSFLRSRGSAKNDNDRVRAAA